MQQEMRSHRRLLHRPLVSLTLAMCSRFAAAYNHVSFQLTLLK